MRFYAIQKRNAREKAAWEYEQRTQAQEAAAAPDAEQPRRTRSTPARLGGPLSRTQKAELCLLAREAFGASGATGDPEEWRREQQLATTGKESLTLCTQDDYLPLKARFLELKGESGRAMNAHISHATEPKRVARYNLNAALADANLPLAYAEAICRRTQKCGLEEASAKQIWRVVYTIRNRKKKNGGRN